MTRSTFLRALTASLVAALCFLAPAARACDHVAAVGVDCSACALANASAYATPQAAAVSQAYSQPVAAVAVPVRAYAVPVQANVHVVRRTFAAAPVYQAQAVAVPVQTVNAYSSVGVGAGAGGYGGFNAAGAVNRGRGFGAGLFGGGGQRTVTKSRAVTKTTGTGLIGRILGR